MSICASYAVARDRSTAPCSNAIARLHNSCKFAHLLIAPTWQNRYNRTHWQLDISSQFYQTSYAYRIIAFPTSLDTYSEMSHFHDHRFFINYWLIRQVLLLVHRAITFDHLFAVLTDGKQIKFNTERERNRTYQSSITISYIRVIFDLFLICISNCKSRYLRKLTISFDKVVYDNYIHILYYNGILYLRLEPLRNNLF